MSQVLTMPGFWICLIILHVQLAFKDILSSDYAGFRICLIILHVQQTFKDISSSDHARVLNMTDHLACSIGFRRYLKFWLCQGSEYDWSSYMFNSLLKMSRVLTVSGFWICLIILHVQQAFEDILSSDYARALNMPYHLRYKVLNMSQALNVQGFWICYI